MVSGSCILRVGQQDVLKASHESVVAAIKQNLLDSVEKEGEPSVDLKISYSHMEQLVCMEQLACMEQLVCMHMYVGRINKHSKQLYSWIPRIMADLYVWLLPL